jgi:hypothetical protein
MQFKTGANPRELVVHGGKDEFSVAARAVQAESLQRDIDRRRDTMPGEELNTTLAARLGDLAVRLEAAERNPSYKPADVRPSDGQAASGQPSGEYAITLDADEVWDVSVAVQNASDIVQQRRLIYGLGDAELAEIATQVNTAADDWERAANHANAIQG